MTALLVCRAAAAAVAASQWVAASPPLPLPLPQGRSPPAGTMSLASLWRGSSERERLNPGGANGFSEALETELPSLASPRSPRSPQEERQLRRMARLAVAGVILVVFLATMVTLVAATVIRCRREGGAGCLMPAASYPSRLWPPSGAARPCGLPASW